MSISEKYYAALTNDNASKVHICRAWNKKQMKKRGMNMKLNWERVENLEAAKSFGSYWDASVKSIVDLTRN